MKLLIGKLKNSNNDQLKRKESDTKWLFYILEQRVSGAAWNLWGVVSVISAAALGGHELTSKARQGAETLITPLLAGSGVDKERAACSYLALCLPGGCYRGPKLFKMLLNHFTDLIRVSSILNQYRM